MLCNTKQNTGIDTFSTFCWSATKVKQIGPYFADNEMLQPIQPSGYDQQLQPTSAVIGSSTAVTISPFDFAPAFNTFCWSVN
jgi:hypothetical protein